MASLIFLKTPSLLPLADLESGCLRHVCNNEEVVTRSITEITIKSHNSQSKDLHALTEQFSLIYFLIPIRNQILRLRGCVSIIKWAYNWHRSGWIGIQNVWFQAMVCGLSAVWSAQTDLKPIFPHVISSNSHRSSQKAFYHTTFINQFCCKIVKISWQNNVLNWMKMDCWHVQCQMAIFLDPLT